MHRLLPLLTALALLPAAPAAAEVYTFTPGAGQGGGAAAPAPAQDPAGSPTATTGSVLQRAADALRTTNVHVDPDAENQLSEADVRRLKQRIADADVGPVFVAVLPGRAVEEAGGDEVSALRELAQRTGQEGTYAGVVGNRFRAGSTVRRDADEAADAAFERAGSQGVAATLLAFVDELDDPGATGGTTRGFPEGSLLFLGAIGGGVGLMALASRRRRRKELEQEVAELRAAANDDLVALGEDVRAVDLDIEMPGVDPRAKEHLGTALAAYEEAETAIPRAEHPDDFEPIAARIDQGRFAMQAVRALLAGQPVPERRPPCFFDPRHGPSVADVHWAPDGYEPRPVPVCAADELRLESGRDPDVRHVLAGGRQVPLYDAPAYFSPYAGGFFGMATGFMLPGLLFGGLMGPAMLGGGLFGGPMLGGGFGGGFGDGGGGGFDVGGGDFGGDFGGGGDF